MTRDTLIALAERCEAASGPDRQLDGDIHLMLHGKPGDRIDWAFGNLVERYSASVDAALSLVPEGWEGALYWGIRGFKPEAQLETEELRRASTGDFRPISASAETLALALCAAALRARAASLNPDGKGEGE